MGGGRKDGMKRKMNEKRKRKRRSRIHEKTKKRMNEVKEIYEQGSRKVKSWQTQELAL